MSYKTKQEAFTAMKDALATLQKLNLPLPKPYQDLVDKCTKVVAANTKTDAVAMDLGGDKTTLTITIDGLDFVPKHLKILSVANKNTVHNVSKSALTTEPVPIDKLKHEETYKVLLYADEKPAPDAKPNNITPFTFDKKYDKVVVKIKTKSKETPQKDQPQKCSVAEAKKAADATKSALTALYNSVETTLETTANAFDKSLSLITKALEDDASAPTYGLKEFLTTNFFTATGYIPLVGDIIKDNSNDMEKSANANKDYIEKLERLKTLNSLSDMLIAWEANAKSLAQAQALILSDRINAAEQQQNCQLLHNLKKNIENYVKPQAAEQSIAMKTDFIKKVARESGVTLTIICGFTLWVEASDGQVNEKAKVDYDFVLDAQLINAKRSGSAFQTLIQPNIERATVESLKKEYAGFEVSILEHKEKIRTKQR